MRKRRVTHRNAGPSAAVSGGGALGVAAVRDAAASDVDGAAGPLVVDAAAPDVAVEVEVEVRPATTS